MQKAANMLYNEACCCHHLVLLLRLLLQAAVMRQLFACCSARQVKWLLRVIVKDLKVGMVCACSSSLWYQPLNVGHATPQYSRRELGAATPSSLLAWCCMCIACCSCATLDGCS